MGKAGQNTGYEKSYFQGANSKDTSFFIKYPKHLDNKNIKRKSKLKKRKK